MDGFVETTVSSVHVLTAAVRAIRVAKPHGLQFLPSQAYMLRLNVGGGRWDGRPLSASCSPAHPYLEFTVRHSPSEWKAAFWRLAIGDTVRLRGPGPRIVFEESRPAVFLSGGVGMTPFKCMLEHARDAQLAGPHTLYLASPTEADIPWRSELDDIAAAAPAAKVVHVLTRPLPGWAGASGRFDAARVGAIVAAHAPEAPVYYVSGPPGMVADLHALLEGAGVPRAAVRVESFRSAASYDAVEEMQVTAA